MPKVLIVDDDPVLRKIYSRYLTGEAFEVLEASTGEQAISKFREETLDVILLDLRMPSTNVENYLPALRRQYPVAKIIVSSAYDLHFQKETVRTADDYFNKGEGCRVLTAKIKALLSSDGKAEVK